VTLHFETFTDTAEMAGVPRLYGGYHIAADSVEGLPRVDAFPPISGR
jgi:hypothetical protein